MHGVIFQMVTFVEYLARHLHIQEVPDSILNLKTVSQTDILHDFTHIGQENAVKVAESRPQQLPSMSLKIHQSQPSWTLREPESGKGVFMQFM
jgi:hypothetical protein